MIFECFRCFWKVFCLKILKISKILFCPVLTTQSRVSQVASFSRVFAGYFWRLVREWKVQLRRLLRDFRGSARESLAGRPSSREKHLENFFKFLSLSVLAAWTGDFVATHFSREKCVFGKNRGSFLNLFQFSLELRAPTFKLHCCFISAQNLQVTGMGFLSWTLFYLILWFSLWIFRICLCF